jgi:thioredoxin
MKLNLFVIASAVVFIVSMGGCKNTSDKPASIPAMDTSVIVKSTIHHDTATFISKPVNITKSEFIKLVMNYEINPNTWVYLGKKPCIIDFYADWCAPCRMTAPILDELAKEYAGKVDFYKVDIEKERDLASYIGISNIPTFLACPLIGNPSLTTGVGRSREETKQMFVAMINEITK